MTKPSDAAMFEAIGRARAAAEVVAAIPTRLRAENAICKVRISDAQLDEISRIGFHVSAEIVRLCTLLHKINDAQPTTGESPCPRAA